ncbi:MAG: phosphoribosylaminoimidazolesuccinocarboxamide synthase [Chromatocurvus sp.]
MPPVSEVLAINDTLPIRRAFPVHSGKVRSVYWLTESDSARLVAQRGYAVASDARLGVMVISDRLSAFDCLWQAEGGLHGVPGKGAALNAIASHWFRCFADAGLAPSHILEVPHPLVWIVQRARPVAIEAIARQYITGSMWRAYESGERAFCGNQLPEGLQRDQRLPELLVTPSTKGILAGIPDVPAADDVNVSTAQICQHFERFQFASAEDVEVCIKLLRSGFDLIATQLADKGLLLVDTKFEFGYVPAIEGVDRLIYMDEVGTPDSSRIWDAEAYRNGRVRENSKEVFRQSLLSLVDDPGVLLDAGRMPERQVLARDTVLPRSLFDEVSSIYLGLAECITGRPAAISADPRQDILDVLGGDAFRLVD